MSTNPSGNPKTGENPSFVARLKHLLLVLTAIAAFVLAVPFIVLLASWQPYAGLAVAAFAAFGSYWTWRRDRRLPLVGKWATAVCIFALFSFMFAQTGYWAIGDRLAKIETERAEKSAKAATEKARIEQEVREKATLAAAEAEAKRKREADEMVALRKSNPDEYLSRLKDKDLATWETEAKALRPKLYAAHLEDLKRQKELAEYTQQRKSPKDYLTLDFTWSAGGFGAVMLANFTIKSTLQFPVKDVLIRCVGSGNSGTELGKVSQTVYEIIPPKSTKRLNNVNMGFIPGQMARASCEIVSVQAV